MKPFDFSQNLRGVGIVLRASLNVPVENGEVKNTFRIDAALTTIEKLSRTGARTSVVAHIGRQPTDSLYPVFQEIKKRTKTPVSFVDAVVGQNVCKKVEALKPGEVLILENVRRDQREILNDDEFAQRLASYGSIYVNDAFPASHRSHASVIGIPKHIPGFAGPAFMHEYKGITPALTPERPNVAIVGGAKFITKEPLIRRLLEKYDHVCIGGALANDFFLAKGMEVGESLVSRSADVTDLLDNEKIILPTDVVVLGPDGIEKKSVLDVSPKDSILDIGPESITSFGKLIKTAKLVLWNGPLGNFEKGFAEGTERMAETIAKADIQSIVGGGDTVFAIQKLNLSNKFTHVSTAGGAMLDFIVDGTLPGIEALY